MNAPAARWGRRLGFYLLVLALPLLAAAEVPEADLEAHARLLFRWKLDPDHYARLKRDYHAFRELPAERQAQLRKLDHDLHSPEGKEHQRLLGVLERYRIFLDGLSAAERQRLAQVTGGDRLALIKQLQFQNWYEQLPFKVREDLAALPEAQRAAALTKVREEDRRRKRLLAFATNKGTVPLPKGESRERPLHVAQYPAEIAEFVFGHIKPRLTQDELRKLDEAEGRVAPLARLIVDLAQKYPVLPPIQGREAVTDRDDLPRDVQQKLLKADKLGGAVKAWARFKREVEPHRKQWPEFALALTKYAADEKVALPPLGASKPDDFTAEIQTAIRRLAPDDQKTLQALEKKWPDYPLKLHEVARKASPPVPLPGMSLPGTKAYWDALTRQ